MKSLARRLAPLAIVAALALTACSSPAPEPTSTRAADEADPALEKLLPDSIRESGVMKIGSSLATAPVNYTDANDQPTGLYVDMLNIAAAKLGITIDWVRIPYAGLRAALESGRLDGAIPYSTTPINLEKLDVVPIAQQFQGLLIPAGNPKHIKKIDDLCGLTIAFTNGSLPAQEAAQKIAADCEKKGKPTTASGYPSAAEATTSIKSGRADALVNTNIQNLYDASQSDAFETALFDEMAEAFGSFPQGLGFLNTDHTLGTAVAAAMAASQKDGSYLKVLKKYKMADLELTDPIELATKDGK